MYGKVLKEKLTRGQTVYGTFFQHSVTPAIVDFLPDGALDFVIVSAEHNALDLAEFFSRALCPRIQRYRLPGAWSGHARDRTRNSTNHLRCGAVSFSKTSLCWRVLIALRGSEKRVVSVTLQYGGVRCDFRWRPSYRDKQTRATVGRSSRPEQSEPIRCSHAPNGKRRAVVSRRIAKFRKAKLAKGRRRRG
jgi:hypothetical protein